METLLILTLENGNFQQGFAPVTIQIQRKEENSLNKVVSKLPPAPEIPDHYQNWQQQYYYLMGYSRLGFKRSKVTNVSVAECHDCAETLRNSFNQWLNPLKQELQQLISGNSLKEILLLVQTKYIVTETTNILYRLPWCAWDFLANYYQFGVAFSFRNSKLEAASHKQRRQTTRLRRVKILSILGSGVGINIEPDQQLIADLRQEGASPVFLTNPKRGDLVQLWDESWDIICFSGHSQSVGDGNTGWLGINPQEELDIEELKNALRTSTQQGLQLLIFNSCDGLGLAKALAEINIPQIIIWQEPVPDLVAQKFLGYLLNSFANNKSIYMCLREAREKLQLAGFEEKIPGINALPAIYQNSPEAALTWQQMRHTGVGINSYDGIVASTVQKEQRNRQVLLNKVRNNWLKKPLERNLQGQVLIELGLEERFDVLQHPWDMVWEEPESLQQPRVLPRGLRAIDKFDELGVGRTMLILGEPGSGKTFTLLQMAKDLLRDAELEASLPIPVIFNLSSWGSRQRNIRFTDWLVQELDKKYDVSQSLGTYWIKNQQLLLLLDGLDEVELERRESCLRALNQFKRECGQTEMLVCCRIKDYEALSTKLQFQGAIYLQALNQEQIDEYLAQAGERLSALRQLLQVDPNLQELAKTPLMLNIMSLAYQHLSPEDLSVTSSVEEERRRLFDAYIERMLNRKSQPNPPKSKLCSWLRAILQIFRKP